MSRFSFSGRIKGLNMCEKARLGPDWEPVILSDRVLAEGTWSYQGKV
jgi:hypothetical protein